MSSPVSNLPAYPIKARLELDGVNVLLLSVPPEHHYPENVFGMTQTCDILWQVEARPSKVPGNRYTSIRDEVGVIAAKTEDGMQRLIDPKSGKVLSEEPA